MIEQTFEQAIEQKGRIFNVQRYSIYDGEGIRTLVFFKGCNIRCDWCANPEGISSKYQVMFSRDKCVSCGRCAEVCPAGVHVMKVQGSETIHHVDRTVDCIGCKRCEEICTSEALNIMGKEVTVSELMDIILRDYDFYLSSGGGVTLSGGEVSLQADFAAALLAECKKAMVNTAIETNGTTNITNYEKLAPVTDLFLFDLKQIDTDLHRQLFGIGNEQVKRNLERLVELKANVVVRMPLIRGYNDSYESITGAIEYVSNLAKKGSIQRIDFLPYHQLGKSKYDMLDLEYPVPGNPGYSSLEMDMFDQFLERFDFDVRLVRH
ncbi:choline TMA-lyase-activating enzyme [Endozoicomonas ascidiicola]|uniref:choline TMA-lyase-activating enzyme n=1 Tax=Endozoicomonas ascidiicola TaxID=1698521 RepID=UPI000831EAFF|nr:choline TMA-lyase-activating enzyme [Endozoicomonas ascidiicola]